MGMSYFQMGHTVRVDCRINNTLGNDSIKQIKQKIDSMEGSQLALK